MTKEVLDIELAGIDPNCPGSEGVAEAVGVDLAHPSPQAVTSEHNVHVMIAKRTAVYGLEEVAFAPAPKVVQVGSEGSQGYLAYRRPALLTSLAIEDTDTALIEEDIIKARIETSSLERTPVSRRKRIIALMREPT